MNATESTISRNTLGTGPWLMRLALDERVARAQRTVLGHFWAALLPLLETLGFAVVLRLFLEVSTTGYSYISFAFVGVFAWRVFAHALTEAAGATNRNASVLHSFPVGAGSCVVASVLATFMDALVGLPVLLVAVVVLEGVPLWSELLWWALVGGGLYLAATLGLGLIMGVVNSIYRDIGNILPAALVILMFAAPVLYPAALVPEPVRTPFLANPIAAAIECFRAGLIGTSPPTPTVLLPAAAIALTMVVAGLALAWRLDSRIREVL